MSGSGEPFQHPAASSAGFPSEPSAPPPAHRPRTEAPLRAAQAAPGSRRGDTATTAPALSGHPLPGLAGSQRVPGLLLNLLLSLLLLTGCADDEGFEPEASFWFTELEQRGLLAVDLERAEPCRRTAWLDRRLGPLAIDADEIFWTIDPVERQLFELNPISGVLQLKGVIVGVERPQALAVDGLGRLWLLDDGRWLHRLDPASGRSLARWTLHPAGSYIGLAVAPRLWALDGGGEIAPGDLLVLRDLPAAGQLGLLRPAEDLATVRELTGLPPLRALIDSRRQGRLYGLAREGGELLELDPVSGEVLWLGASGCASFDVQDGARP
jgi:hypothetical protein